MQQGLALREELQLFSSDQEDPESTKCGPKASANQALYFIFCKFVVEILAIPCYDIIFSKELLRYKMQFHKYFTRIGSKYLCLWCDEYNTFMDRAN